MFKSLLQALRQPTVFWVVLTAGGILAISQGIRLSLGLFVSPMNTGTRWGIATISLALALAQPSVLLRLMIAPVLQARHTQALAQAQRGRLHILGIMEKAMPAPSAELSELAPKIVSLRIDRPDCSCRRRPTR